MKIIETSSYIEKTAIKAIFDEKDLSIMFKLFDKDKKLFSDIARYFTENGKPIGRKTVAKWLKKMYTDKNDLARFEEIKKENSPNIDLSQKDLSIMFKLFDKDKKSFSDIARYFTENGTTIGHITVQKYIKRMYESKNDLARFEELKKSNAIESVSTILSQKELSIMFKLFDKDKKSLSNIASYFAENGRPIGENTVAKWLEKMYTDKNDLARFEELKAKNKNSSILSQKELSIMFKLFDKDKKSLSNIARYFTENGKPITYHTITKYLEKMYTDKNDLVRFEELKKENGVSLGHGLGNKNLQNIANEKYDSQIEIIMQDLFVICNIAYIPKKVVLYFDKNKKQRKLEVDLYFTKADFFFEIFGFSRGEGNSGTDEYQTKIDSKIEILSNLKLILKYIDTRKSPIKGLIKCSEMLDTQICQQQQCNQPLFSNISVQQTLIQMIPLLEKYKISLCTTYIKRLQEMSPQQLGKARKAIERTPAKHQPFPQTQPLNNPNVFRQPNQKVRTAQSEPISLQQIVQELSQQYKSVEMWTPEEQVAMYFKTPENLQAAMGGQQDQSYNFNQYQQQAPQQQQNYFNLNQQQQQAPLARAASSTYYSIKDSL